MARKKKKNNIKAKVISLVVFLILSVTLALNYESIENIIYTSENVIENSNQTSDNVSLDGKLEMHVIDVGQGDSILFIQNDSVMLVDCGTKANDDTVIQYLTNLGIKKIDILVGTHPHDDHMGGMAKVIENFEIGKLYAPDNSNDNITTNWYIELLDTIIQENIEWVYPEVGEILYLGDAKVQILGPSSDKYSNLNNYSIVLRVSYGDIDIMLTGDAEELAEKEILNTGLELESEIYKAGHHGSSTSSSEDFIKTVNPTYTIISAKIGNSYNHPIKSVMEMFERLEIKVFRTDEQGAIIMNTDGTNINFNKDYGSYLSGEEYREK